MMVWLLFEVVVWVDVLALRVAWRDYFAVSLGGSGHIVGFVWFYDAYCF